MLAHDMNELICSVEQNVFEAPEVPNLHLSTTYDNISEEAFPEIRKWVVDEGSRFHRRVREYLAKFDKDVDPQIKGKSNKKISVCSFSSYDHDTSTKKE